MRSQRAGWVEVSSSGGAKLVDPKRLDHLISELPDPDRQRPQIVACVGSAWKRRALNHFFPGHDGAHKPPLDGLADLYRDSSRSHLNHPILFADCTLDGSLQVKARVGAGQSRGQYSDAWASPPPALTHTILTRLIFPFSDVICIFADDFGGLTPVLASLVSWTEDIVATDIPWRARPRVCVISCAPLTKETVHEQKEFDERIRQIKYCGHFSSVRRMRFWPRTSDKSLDRALRQFVLDNELVSACVQRQANHVMFTATHLSWFFTRAVANVAKSPPQPFAFLATSRVLRPLPAHYPDQLAAFLRLTIEHNVPFEVIATVIASSILLDAYPPAAHDFCPADVFYAIYAPSVRRAFEAVPEAVSAAVSGQSRERTNDIRRCMDDIVRPMCRLSDERRRDRGARGDRVGQNGDDGVHGDWAAESHRRVLRKAHDRIRWEKIRSEQCSFFCLLEDPQHVLRCKHAICDACVVRCGIPQPQQDYHYLLEVCPLCSTPCDIRITLKPPTAGLRLLSLDGGGARGVVSLQFLRSLQAALGGAGRIQDYFDMGVGVSAGALIVIALLEEQWDVDHAMDTFRNVLNRTFNAGANRPHAPLSSRRLVRALFRNGHYDQEAVAATLRSCLSARRLFDTPMDGVSRCKTAVTATTVGDGSLVVLPSFNLPRSPTNGAGSGKDGISPTYRHLARRRGDEEPWLWEVAGATSAAPPYFHPVRIGKLGQLQDGGLHNPNPTETALEVSAHYWGPRVARDLVLSIGTGHPSRFPSPQDLSFPGSAMDCAVLRLIRYWRASYSDAIDAETVHERVERMFRALEPPAHTPLHLRRYHRLNLELADGVPPLDDVGSMGHLMVQVARGTGPTTFAPIKLALITSSFYFELDGPPESDDSGRITCKGAVRMRGNPAHVLSLVRDVHTGPVQFVKDDEDLAECQLERRICPTCQRFDQPISFSVAKRTDPVTIGIRFGKEQGYRISGFPQDVEWIVKQQRLDDPFCLPPSNSSRCCLRSRTCPRSSRKRTVSSFPKRASKRRRTQRMSQSWL